jgi:hypothetical protein
MSEVRAERHLCGERAFFRGRLRCFHCGGLELQLEEGTMWGECCPFFTRLFARTRCRSQRHRLMHCA